MGEGDKVRESRDVGERAGQAGPDGRKGGEEVRSAHTREGIKLETVRMRMATQPTTVLTPQSWHSYWLSPNAASEPVSTQHFSPLAEACVHPSSCGGWVRRGSDGGGDTRWGSPGVHGGGKGPGVAGAVSA